MADEFVTTHVAKEDTGITRFTAWRIIIMVTLVLSVIAFFFSAYEYKTAITRDRDIKASQIESCTKVGEPIRTSVIALLQRQIDQSKVFDYHKFFPQIPAETLDQLIQKQREENQALVDQLKSVGTCKSRFN